MGDAGIVEVTFRFRNLIIRFDVERNYVDLIPILGDKLVRLGIDECLGIIKKIKEKKRKLNDK
jgi:hypothetical protein